MKDIVKFFWERYRRAVCMDMANKILGKHTIYWANAEEWISAYKQTLSKSKQNEFDKEWNNLEKQLEDYRDGKKGSRNPLSIG